MASGKFFTTVLVPVLTLYSLRAVPPHVNQYQASGSSGANELSKLPGTLIRSTWAVVVLMMVRPPGDRSDAGAR
jgi:hypothetical protein